MRILKLNTPEQLQQCLPLLSNLNILYPNFNDWFQSQVVGTISSGATPVLLAVSDTQPVGVAIGKLGEDAKIRCVRVLPSKQATGLGVRLIDAMLEELETRHPACTVAEEMFHDYSRVFVQRYGFSLTSVDKGRYRPRKLEYGFNGG